jgi:hypothetical protein
MAIFLGPFTWLYTYRRDPGKATVGLGSLTVVAAIVVPSIMAIRQFLDTPRTADMGNAGESVVYMLIGLVILSPFLLAPCYFPLIFTLMEKRWFLDTPEERSKSAAIMYAAFLGPWTWLYTYKRDFWRFWPAIIVAIGGAVTWASLRISPPTIWVVTCAVIWAAALINAAARRSIWYAKYGA